MKDDAERARERLGKLVAESGRYSSVASHAFSTQGRDIFILASDAIELAVAFAQQPEGWVLVPREPDKAMYDAAWHLRDLERSPKCLQPDWTYTCKAVWSAMLDVAPIPGEE